jgi:hypothetical protein
VSARSLLPIFDSIYLLVLSSWVGAVLCTLCVVRPIVLRVRDLNVRAHLDTALLSRYYTWGSTSAAIALPALLGGPICFPSELRGPWVGVQAIAIIAGAFMMLYGGNSLTPALRAAYAAGPGAEVEVRIARLHKRAVWTDGVVLAIGVGLLVGFVLRGAPRTQGLSDAPPQLRAQKNFEAFQKRQADFKASHKSKNSTAGSGP